VRFLFGRQETSLPWRSAADLAVGCLPVTLSLLYRAAGQSLTGILANDPEQAVYLANLYGPSASSRPMRLLSCGSDCPLGTVVDRE
jgi:hypothetical protein